MPGWLKLLLLAAALLILAALLTGPALATRHRQPGPGPATPPASATPPAPATAATPPAPVTAATTPLTPVTAGTSPPVGKARIVLADHDRLVVTHSTADNTICVLRPPGADPAAILRLARLVVGEGPYRDLAEHLGLPPSWPIILADYPRLVVTRRPADDTVYILRPPGEDPRAVLRAARLILPEDHYEELAAQLGITPSWPLEEPP
jgi:hypothetical protein